MANVVMLIRHAEKPLGEGPPFGMTDDGVVDPESLTARGWQRAGALVRWFGGQVGSSAAGLPLPTHLFASQIAPQSSSRRPQQTLQPLAQSLRLPIDTSVPKADIARLATAIDGADAAMVHLLREASAAGEKALRQALERRWSAFVKAPRPAEKD